jgi:hypothetical protein
MRARYLLAPLLLTLLSACTFEAGPGGDGVTGLYHLMRVNDQALPRWPHALRVESSSGPLEITAPSSIELQSSGTFLQELTLVDRPDGTALRTVTRTGRGTYRRIDERTFEFTGGLVDGTFTGILSPGTGKSERVLTVDRRDEEGLIYSYVMLKGLFIR